MPLMTWRDNLSVNYLPLDEEHKAFLNVVNSSFLSAQARDFQQINEVFKCCFEYARTHFSHEEEIMSRLNYPDIMEHIKSHQSFIQNVAELKQQFDMVNSPDEMQRISLQLANALSVWLLAHISGRDRLLRPYLAKMKHLSKKK